jgi:phospholipase/carboxylesterase
MLPCVEVETGPQPRASVIWLHGLGADGHDFEPLVPELPLPFAVRFVFPHAPVRPVTLNGGYPMRAWFDVVRIGTGAPQDRAGIAASTAEVGALIAREVERGVPERRIALAGFSQGGAIALHAGLRHPRRLAGIVALSTFLPQRDSFAAEASAAMRDAPILLVHGEQDPIVPLELGELTRDALRAAGYAPQWQTYPMPHTVCAPEVELIRGFLGRVLA